MYRKKYEFTGETRDLSPTTKLHRIRAVIDIPHAGVNAGEIGGWIESDSNLSHDYDAWVCGNAHINSNKDFIIIGPIGSRSDFTTFHKNVDGIVCVKCGCFSGTVDEFLEAVQKTHGDNQYGKEYKLAAQLAKVHMDEAVYEVRSIE